VCGRYAFHSPAEAVRRIFGVEDVPALEPRYNIAPTQDVPAIRAGQEGARAFAMLRWGLVPKWAKDRAIGNRMINARAESVAEKPAFRDAFRRRRCLVLADGWYEWQPAPGGKQPWYLRPKEAGPFAFAGLWEKWTDPATGEPLESCTIVTTEAPEAIRRIHDRMPAVVGEENRDRWLDTAYSDTQRLAEILVPAPGAAFEAWPVGRAVNAPGNQGPSLIERVDPATS
jgi:putative SOS response-associated peptidase YedK